MTFEEATMPPALPGPVDWRVGRLVEKAKGHGMNKKDLGLLERAFDAEIGGALEGRPRLMQTKAEARADALVADGLLTKGVEFWRGIKIEGYELTHAGRFAYCLTCEDEEA